LLVSPDERASHGAQSRPSFLRRHRRKLPALSLWLFLLGGSGLYALRTGFSPSEAAHGLLHFMAGALLYVALYAVRPLVLPPPAC